MLPCLRDPGWNIGVPCEPHSLQRGPLLGLPNTWITYGTLGPLGFTIKLSSPWIEHLPRDLPHLWGILGTPLSHSHDTWGESSSHGHLKSCNECHAPSTDRLLLLCCLSGRRQSSPSMILQTFDRPSTLFQVPEYWCGCFPIFLQATCLARTDCSCGPHNPPLEASVVTTTSIRSLDVDFCKGLKVPPKQGLNSLWVWLQSPEEISWSLVILHEPVLYWVRI